MPRSRHAVALVLAALLALGLANTPALAGVTPISHGPRTAPVVALTFDDGWSPANCRRILATLIGDGVPATFFPIADDMRLDPAFWRLVADAGYPIGNHTLTHPEMPSLTYAAQLREIDGARRLAESITKRPMLRVFRPPYGAYDGPTLAAAAAAGFPTVLLWDTSDRDTSLHGTVAEMLAAGERGTNGSVVLLHCGPDATPILLPALIAAYRARGLRFVTVPQLLRLHWTPGGLVTIPTPAMVLDGLSPLPSTVVGATPSVPPGDDTSPPTSAVPSSMAASTPPATTLGATIAATVIGPATGEAAPAEGLAPESVLLGAAAAIAALASIVLATAAVHRRRDSG